MGKSVATGFLIVGTIVGAGFVSGREILSFFGLGLSPWLALVFAALVFLISALFLFIGSKTLAKNVSEVNVRLAGRFHVVADIFLLVNSFIVLAGMLAATDSVAASFFTAVFGGSVPYIASVSAGLLCAVVVCRGVKGLVSCNKFVVPVMAAALLFVCIYTAVTAAGGGSSALRIPNFGAALVYVCMNMVLASTVVTTTGHMNIRTILLSSGIAGGLFGVLTLALICALNRYGDAATEMPVLEMAEAVHPALYYGMLAVIAVSIFTTMLAAMNGLTAWLCGIFGNKFFTALTVLTGGLILSNLGFSTVVTYLYPVIGVLGVAYVALGSVYAIRTLPVWKKIKKVRRITRKA